jgi:putative ABC transport system ATP-binding protein
LNLTPILSTHDLRYTYAKVNGTDVSSTIAFPDVSLNARGLAMLRGASGVGKSTMLHLIVGALRVQPNCGSVHVDGNNIAGKMQHELDTLRPFVVGWIPQRVHLLQSLSVFDNIMLPLAMAGREPPDDSIAIRRRAQTLMTSAGVWQVAESKPSHISVGQAARVCVVRAMLASPKLLVADEPTAALDDESANAIAKLIVDYCRSGGAALVASHDAALHARLRDSDQSLQFTEYELT